MSTEIMDEQCEIERLREQLTGAQTTIALAEEQLRHEQTELAHLRRVLLVPLDYISVQREEHDNLRLVAEAARRWAHDQQTMNRVALQQAVAALEAKP